ncbi:cupin domain-containing protein [Nocardioides sp. YIM 152588]|uniref:cupin domain-containing protein n=1 Tax=Nocardioides sp. YIM 152588 TaxID=3158259 RepID=UPI0032E3C4F5
MARVLDLTSDIPATPVAPDTVLDGTPTAGSRSLSAVSGAEVGVWEITPGTVTDVEVDEVFVVLSGSGSVTFEDGERIDLAPGVAVRLAAGDRTTWVIRETLRKVYVA